MKVLNYGSLNIDYVYTMDEFVKEGETKSSISFKKNIGGKGLNQSIAFKKAGLDIYHAGKIGNDGFFLKEYLKDNGVNVENIFVDDDESGHAIIQVDNNGNNCIILNGGANQRILKEEIDLVLNKFKANDLLILQNEINNVDYIIEEAYKKGMQIAINLAPINGNEKKFDLTKVNIINVNESEGKALANKENPDDVFEELIKNYPNSMIILTLGELGSRCYYQGERFSQNIFKVEVIDTTSAGDTFFGFFLKEYYQTKNIKRALLIASKASSICVSRKGASISIPNYDEVNNNL